MAKRSWVFLVVGLVLGAGLQWTRAADAEPARKVFEIRTYHTFPDRLDALHKRFREHTMKIFEKHGMTNVGYWVPQDSPAHESTLIYVISHPSREAAKANWAAFSADPEWKKLSGLAGYGNADIVTNITSVYLRPAAYSQI